MSVTEFQRHQIFQWLEEAMGRERAAIMMDLLPPVGWGDIATTSDLAMVRIEMSGMQAKIEGELAKLEGEVARLDGRMEHGFARLQRHVYATTVVGNATVIGLLLALVG